MIKLTMPNIAKDDHLLDKSHLTVVLRLVVGKRGKIDYGELVDTNGVLLGRFNGWGGMNGVLREWVETEKDEGE